MLLRAIVNSSQIQENPRYNQNTGKENPNFWFNMTVIEKGTDKILDIQIQEGHTDFDELLKQKRQNTPADKLRETAEHLRNKLPQMKDQEIELEVLTTKLNLDDSSNPKCRLVCRFIRVIQEDPPNPE